MQNKNQKEKKKKRALETLLFDSINAKLLCISSSPFSFSLKQPFLLYLVPCFFLFFLVHDLHLPCQLLIESKELGVHFELHLMSDTQTSQRKFKIVDLSLILFYIYFIKVILIYHKFFVSSFHHFFLSKNN